MTHEKVYIYRDVDDLGCGFCWFSTRKLHFTPSGKLKQPQGLFNTWCTIETDELKTLRVKVPPKRKLLEVELEVKVIQSVFLK